MNSSFVVFFVAIGVAACLGAHLINPLDTRAHRIVGGVESVPHAHPSILNLGNHSCAATLIHPRWAVTAAHCVPIATLVAGDHVINQAEGNEQRRNVIRNIVHPDYQTPNGFSNDVALLELESEFELNEFVEVMPVPAFGFEPTGDALVAGWGTTEEGTLAYALREVVVPLVSQASCIESYGGSIDESMICAGEADKDSCQGDSGGPLYCRAADGSPVHCGVVSWGSGCGRPGFPGVYARSSYFADFYAAHIPPQ